jgi:hypothetical protein
MAGLETQAAANGQLLSVNERRVHTMIGGVSSDIAFTSLDIGDASTDAEIKTAVAQHFSLPTSKLTHFAVDRHENGNVTVRPEAVFG